MSQLLERYSVVVVDVLHGHHDEGVHLDSPGLTADNSLQLLLKLLPVFIPFYDRDVIYLLGYFSPSPCVKTV